jgi:8-oxo-dGTP pyrophosphatase MutT (NUDIX family)
MPPLLREFVRLDYTAPMIRTRTAGGIVIGPAGTIAMVRHRNSDMWLFPKGHHEMDETDEQAARRETYEETGISDLEYIDDLGSYERHPILPSGESDLSTLKEIRMYLFMAPASAQLAPSFEIAEARWVPLSQVVDTVGNPRDRAWFVSVFERVRQAVMRD